MGVKKKMPLVSARGGDSHGTIFQGTESLRNMEQYTMTAPLKAPYPYPGGKSKVASYIWQRFGSVDNYVEPFAGSAAVLYARPAVRGVETINDADGFITNALRAIVADPDAVAAWADEPPNEINLTARHLWLKAQRPDLERRLMAEPDYCDPKIAGWWLWGMASWIGDGWCIADGPWINLDGVLTDRRTLPSDEQGEGVSRKMPEVSDRGERGTEALRQREGVDRKRPAIGGRNRTNDHGNSLNALDTPALHAAMHRLAERLRRVRILCGDWRRCVAPSITVNHGTTALFLDPPYPSDEHAITYRDGNDVWYEVVAWAAQQTDPRLRIIVAGYYSERADAMFPANWQRSRWATNGGYANQGNERGRDNARREMLWLSPTCEAEGQMMLFGEEA